MIERRRVESPLIYWVRERESIRQKKEAGLPAPWTDDPILQEYRFCNVRREHDRVSRWMVENVLSQYDHGSFESRYVFLEWVALCRWVNWPPTLEAILKVGGPEEEELVTGTTINLPKIGSVIDELCGFGVKAWTGAYMIRAPSKRKYPGMSKGKFIAEVVVQDGLRSVSSELLDAISPIHPKAEAVFDIFCKIPNWGSFMSGQVVADLTYTSLLGKASDLYTWAPMGPGSRRGYNRLLGLPLYQPPPDKSIWCAQLATWRADIIKKLGPEYDDLTLHDVQNCLCEVDKYLRVKNGEGRPRSRYKPEVAF